MRTTYDSISWFQVWYCGVYFASWGKMRCMIHKYKMSQDLKLGKTWSWPTQTRNHYLHAITKSMTILIHIGQRQNSSSSHFNSCHLLRCERVVETQAEFHFSWVYTFSATLSFLRNWAGNDRYQLRPSTPAQLCWSSSRLQPFQNYNLIKFALIRPSTLNHDRNLWNFRGAPDETTCFAGFFGVPAP